ncbi:MAG: hypothetical protein KA792_00960 [Bacteroidales bacterium]|nr:hypothetical protein [Bacteroidales bacterium]
MKWSKLKAKIEALFVPNLGLNIYCNAYPIRGQWGTNNSVPRFYFKLGKEIIWDFPKDYKSKLKNIDFYQWTYYITFSENIANYINTPVNKILSLTPIIKDALDDVCFTMNNNDLSIAPLNKSNVADTVAMAQYDLIKILFAADRRLGLNKLNEFFLQTDMNNAIKIILNKRKTLNYEI